MVAGRTGCDQPDCVSIGDYNAGHRRERCTVGDGARLAALGDRHAGDGRTGQGGGRQQGSAAPEARRRPSGRNLSDLPPEIQTRPAFHGHHPLPDLSEAGWDVTADVSAALARTSHQVKTRANRPAFSSQQPCRIQARPLRSVRQEERDFHRRQQVFRGAAENELSDLRAAIGSHDEKIG